MSLIKNSSPPSSMTETPAPLYEQVKSYVLEHIQSGKWPVHYQIPSEHMLVRELGMSRMTIHRALRELTQNGYLNRIQGVGTFVARPEQKATTFNLAGISKIINARGHLYSCDIHFLQAEPVSSEYAVRLGIKEGDSVYRSYFVHRENGIPVMLEDRYTNPDLVPDMLSQDFALSNIDQYFLDTCNLVSHEHQINACLSTAEAHHFLELDQPVACLVINRRSWSGNRILSAAHYLYPGHRFKLSC